MSADTADILARARAALGAGRLSDVRAMLQPLLASSAPPPEANRLYAETCAFAGDLPSAERFARAAAEADPADAEARVTLGRILFSLGQAKPAEAELREAHRLDPLNAIAATGLSGILHAAGKAAEAAAVTAPLAGCAAPSREVLYAHGGALADCGRADEALVIWKRLMEADPRDAEAVRGCVDTLIGLGRYAEAEAVALQAIQRRVDSARLRYALARAQLALDHQDDAQAGLTMLAERMPDFLEPQRMLADLIWRRTGDVDQALRWLDRGIAAAPRADALKLARAQVLGYAGREDEAYAALAEAARKPGSDCMRLHLMAAQTIGKTDPKAAAAHAEAAYAAAPEEEDVLFTLCSVRLGQGRAAEAAELAATLREMAPDDQHAIALQATAWRILGDPRAEQLFDYERVVSAARIDTPQGWPDLEAYLAALALELDELHATKAHPVGQSVRGGTQTTRNLLHVPTPAIRAFFKALDGPIRRHIDRMGAGDDPLRARNLGGYRYAGIWSVRLKPGEGSHVDHVHPAGWLSSACYIDVPPAVRDGASEGWIKFGQPGVPTRPELPPQFWVKPEPGRLVLFPSYMWHGVTPFGGDRTRLTIAFDLLPAEGSPEIAR